MERKKMLHVLQEARGSLGSYDQWPTLPAGTDPMPCLSRNRVPQPFYLIGENDQVIVALAGESTLVLPGSNPRELDLALGEAVYIPAGQPSRVVPKTESVHLTYKAEPPGWEAAVWYCQSCGGEVFRKEFNASEVVPQDGYWQACQEFNADERWRTCPACQAVHPLADLTDIRWPEVAEQIRADDAAQAAPAVSGAR